MASRRAKKFDFDDYLEEVKDAPKSDPKNFWSEQEQSFIKFMKIKQNMDKYHIPYIIM